MKNDNEPRSTRRHNFSRKLVQCTLFSACNHERRDDNLKNDYLATVNPTKKEISDSYILIKY